VAVVIPGVPILNQGVVGGNTFYLSWSFWNVSHGKLAMPLGIQLPVNVQLPKALAAIIGKAKNRVINLARVLKVEAEMTTKTVFWVASRLNDIPVEPPAQVKDGGFALPPIKVRGRTYNMVFGVHVYHLTSIVG
jgi:hypothetical protein